MIGPRTAFALYAILIAFAIIRLHGLALYLALVIIVGLAAKTTIDYFRRRIGQ